MKLLKNKSGHILFTLLLAGTVCVAQDSTGTEKKELQLNVSYYLPCMFFAAYINWNNI